MVSWNRVSSRTARVIRRNSVSKRNKKRSNNKLGVVALEWQRQQKGEFNIFLCCTASPRSLGLHEKPVLKRARKVTSEKQQQKADLKAFPRLPHSITLGFL